MSSMRKFAVLLPLWATSRSSRMVMSFSGCEKSEIGWRRPILVALGQRRRRIGNHLLVQEMHEQEERLGFEHQQDRLAIRIVIEMLMHAAILDKHHVAGL